MSVLRVMQSMTQARESSYELSAVSSASVLRTDLDETVSPSETLSSTNRERLQTFQGRFEYQILSLSSEHAKLGMTGVLVIFGGGRGQAPAPA